MEKAAMARLPSRWAMRKRFILDTFSRKSKPWSFTHRQWQRQIMDDDAARVVIMKAAQMGLTEVAMTRAMHSIDARGLDVLYLFPTEAAASDFSAARFDPMLDESPELRRVFSDVSNVGLKRAGPTNLYLRGSNARTSIKSIPVAGLVLDEFEEMDQKSVVLVRKRLLAQLEPWEMNLSTPQYPETGIHSEYLESDQLEWWVPCPHCGKHQVLELEANLVVPGDWELEGAHWRCAECGEPWSEDERVALLDRGEWRARNPGARIRGYHVSQLYSPVMRAPALAEQWLESRRGASAEEDFFNSLLGLPYEAKGVNITRTHVEMCLGTHEQVQSANVPVALGIDVGAVNHYMVGLIINGQVHVIAAGHTDWAGCDMLMQAFSPDCCVIDANPERHMAVAFRTRWEGTVYTAFYPDSDHMQGQEINWDDERGNVSIHRTALGDRVAARLINQTISLPHDTPREDVRHLSNVYRAMETSPTTGKTRAKWKHRGADHLFHAGIYLEVALERVDDGLDDLPGGDPSSEDPAWVSSGEQFGFNGAESPW